MVDKELIEIWRNMLKPSISSRLLKTNYEGKGEQDKEEFERDFDEILDLALVGLRYKAQLPQEDTTKDATSSTSSTAGIISRQFEEIVVSYPPVDLCNYPEYKGKPYFSIRYKENGEDFIGYGTYSPEVLSRYLRDYFMPLVQPEERTEKRTETHACDTISRQAAIDALDAIGHIATMPDGDKCIRRSAVKYTLSMLPSAPPEHDGFYEFLFNVINPNDMEKYIAMYYSKGVKSNE